MILYFFRRWFSLHHKPAVRVGTALFIALLLNLLFGAAFYLAESGKQPGLGFWDSVWWSMVTMTTASITMTMRMTMAMMTMILSMLMMMVISMMIRMRVKKQMI